MKCPNCYCPHLYVTNTYTRSLTLKGKLVQIITRRRQCRYCGKIIKTVEREITKTEELMNDIEVIEEDEEEDL